MTKHEETGWRNILTGSLMKVEDKLTKIQLQFKRTESSNDDFFTNQTTHVISKHFQTYEGSAEHKV